VRLVRFIGTALALLTLGALLAGCDTTRDKSARAKISADRELAQRKPVVVKKQFADVSVEQVQAVGKGKDALVVVRLKNTSDDTFAALPINVRAGGKILNRGPNIPYFANHVPALAPNKESVWIFKPGKRIKKGRLTALVGAVPPSDKVVPDVRAEDVILEKSLAIGRIENHSGTPQYATEIYLTVYAEGRYKAAATGRVVKLSSSGEKPFSLPIQGRTAGLEPDISLGSAILVEKP
jgi:hypothetical protein